jgi:hypothetical protein
VVIGFLVALLVFGGPFIRGTQAGNRATEAATPMPLVFRDPLTRLVLAPPDASIFYSVGREALYQSDDGGLTWHVAGRLPPPGRIVAAVDYPRLLLAGSHSPCASTGGEEPPLKRSVNGGATWSTVKGMTGVLPLAVWSRSGPALGSSCSGLQLSTDGGQHWQPSSVLTSDYETSAFAVIAGTDAPAGLIAGTSEGGTSQVWRIDLSDPTQPTVSQPLRAFWGGVALAAEALAGEGERFLVGAATGVYVSNDTGATWIFSRAGLEEVTISVDPLQDATPIPDAERQRGYGISAVAIDPDNPAHFWVGTIGGLFESTDGGAHWNKVDAVPDVVVALVVVAKNRLLLVQTQDAVVVMPIVA